MTATKGLGTTGNGVGTVTPLDHKLAQSGLIVKAGAGTNLIRAGIFYDGVTNFVTGAANMSYNVAPFTAALTRGAGAGTVLIANDGSVNVTTTAAPASNSRIDIVYVWQREFSLDGVNSNPVIGVAQGTSAASPVAPSLAAFPGALELARITVPAGVTATNTGTTITQTAPLTATAGGVLVFRTDAERDAFAGPTGQQGVVLSSGISYSRFGGAWTRPGTTDHAEYTYTANSVPNATTLTTGSFAVDATRTARNPVSATGTGTVTLAAAGVFIVEWVCALGAASTGRSFISLKDGTMTLSRSSYASSEDQVSVTATVYADAPGKVVSTEVFKTTGGLSNLSGRLRVTKLAE